MYGLPNKNPNALVRQENRLDISHKALYKNKTNNIEFLIWHEKKLSVHNYWTNEPKIIAITQIEN